MPDAKTDLKVLTFEQRGKMFQEELGALQEKYGVMIIARFTTTESAPFLAIPGIADMLEQPKENGAVATG